MTPGAIVGQRFRIEARIGEGASGVVYRATQLAIGRSVALKVLKRHLAELPQARARFEREAKVASALGHPRAVSVIDFGEHEGRVFLAMELLPGRSLRDALAGGPLKVPRALPLAADVADVMVAAHAAGLVHRDLKPENIFVTDDGARVLDFGLAFIAGGDDGQGRLTQEGVVTGTPAYLSPEQARGESVGPATDIYALGCTLFECVAGRPPFAGGEMHVLTRQLFSAPPSLRGLAAEAVPVGLDELLARMLRKGAGERPSAEAVLAALTELDPSAHERGRGPVHLAGRAARMVRAVEPGARAAPRLEVAIVGAATPELLLALTANELPSYVVTNEQPIEDVSAIWAPGAPPERVRELAGHGSPVVTDTDAGDQARIRRLLSAGATEVLSRPVRADELARRLRRAIRRFAR